jgi:hypothetical protein
VANTYYQHNQNLNVAYESARLQRGTSPNISIATNGTQLLAGIAKGDPQALQWLDNYVAQLKKIAAANPNLPVYATIDQEFKVRVRVGSITGESADPLVYGKALDIFFKKAKAAAPNLKPTYWIVGWDRAFEGSVGTKFTTPPSAILFDPYANTGSDTFASIAKADIDWIKSQPFYVGQTIALAEIGMPVAFGDASLARFYTDARKQMANLGLEWAVLFNRTKDENYKISTGTYPNAVNAFSNSLQQRTG